jgi:hypothetical protein
MLAERAYLPPPSQIEGFVRWDIPRRADHNRTEAGAISKLNVRTSELATIASNDLIGQVTLADALHERYLEERRNLSRCSRTIDTVSS